ncbi:MAG: Universal bacterial protein YeaZ [Candidatus Peregrinibacteria bacterium Greene0416_19]|nr:MAG: Universal bacterial protein YeaZ [Candidatus Peregrinibacteria bacterium Greene0416_19]
MRAFFLDLASNDGLLACVTPEQVVASVPVDHRIDDADLVPLIERTLADAGWEYKDVARVACVTGPGGFTSLRVAVAAVNAMAGVLGIPVCGIHLSEVYRSRFSGARLSPSSRPTPTPQPPPPSGEGVQGVGAGVQKKGKNSEQSLLGIWWLHSTKKHELFLCGFGSFAERVPEPICMSLDQIRSVVHAGDHWMGEFIDEHRRIMDDAGLQPARLQAVESALPGLLAEQTYQKKLLQPWYGRGW